jgi:hypothetical protein
MVVVYHWTVEVVYCVSLDSSCVLLQWLCTTGSDCVSLDSSCVLLQWLCTTGSDCVSLDSSCVLLAVVVYHWTIVVYYYGSTQSCSIGWHCSSCMLLVDCHGDYQITWSSCVLLDHRDCDR